MLKVSTVRFGYLHYTNVHRAEHVLHRFSRTVRCFSRATPDLATVIPAMDLIDITLTAIAANGESTLCPCYMCGGIACEEDVLRHD